MRVAWYILVEEEVLILDACAGISRLAIKKGNVAALVVGSIEVEASATRYECSPTVVGHIWVGAYTAVGT